MPIDSRYHDPDACYLYISDISRYREMYIVSVRTPYKNEETAPSPPRHVTHAQVITISGTLNCMILYR